MIGIDTIRIFDGIEVDSSDCFNGKAHDSHPLVAL